jgi:tRNA pseudouridine38-40 synthase
MPSRNRPGAVRNVKIVLEYDGTRYRGWQIQKNARTVAGVLTEALGAVLKEPPRVFAAGRTDAGVHAMGQVVSFRTRSDLAPREIRERLNDRLPTDVNVLDVEQAPLRFHARHAARSRLYRYQLSTRRTAFAKRYVWWIRSPLDREILGEIAEAIPAARDFRSFAEGHDTDDAEGEAKPGGRARVLESLWYEEADLLIYRIRADRFLWKMVRRLVGAMVAAALGQIERDAPIRWLREHSREPARWTAPPSGLFLEEVEYPAAAERPAPPQAGRGIRSRTQAPTRRIPSS